MPACDTDIWIWYTGNIYEYISVYVNYLEISERGPKILMDALENKDDYFLKGTGPISFHVRCDFFCESNGVL